MDDTKQDALVTGRRAMLAGVGAVGVAAALAGCGTAANDPAPAAGGAATPATTAGAATSAAAPPPSKAADAGTPALAKTSDIPVGGGKIFDSQNIVVTQPTAGNFKAFSATCTHMGCTVGSIRGGNIICPCHGSQYSIKDGSVKTGPAPQPLPAKKVTVTDGEITVA